MDKTAKIIMMISIILILIATIGTGVLIFFSEATIHEAEISASASDAEAKQIVNASLAKYAGEKIKGSEVKEFVKYLNTLEANKSLPQDITINGGHLSNFSVSGYINSKYYNVMVSDTNSDGYYDTVMIN